MFIISFINQLKHYTFFVNSGYDYFVALMIFLGLILALKIFQMIILAHLNRLAKKTKTDFDDVLIEIFKKVRPPFYFFNVWGKSEDLSGAEISWL